MLERCGYDGDARVLPERPGRADAELRGVAAGPQAGRAAARERLRRRVRGRLGRRDARRRRRRRLAAVLDWGYDRALADQREVLDAFHVRFDVWSSERALVDAGQDGRRPGRSARAGPRLRRRRGGVAAVHRLRRRQGPAADQVRRRAHLPAARHRLPPRQVRAGLRPAHRRVGRRPPRLRPPDAGGHRGPRPRPRRVRGAHRADRAARARRRGGPPLQAGRRHRSSCATSSTRSVPTSPGSPTCCSPSTASRPSTSTSSPASRTRTRSSTCSTPTPGSTRSWARPRPPGCSGTRSPTSTCRCSPTSARSSCCARCPSCPTQLALAAKERAPHKITNWVRELADRFHGFYHDCYVIGSTCPARRSTQARLWLVEAARIGLRHRPRPARRLRARVRCDGRRRCPPSLLPDNAVVGDDGHLSIGGCDLLDVAGRVRHAAVRLRRGAPARPLPRGGRRLPRRRRLRHQGVPVRGHGPPGPRGGHAPRRGHRRRAARGPHRRRARRPAGAARQQQVAGRAGHGPQRRRGPHRGRQLRRARAPHPPPPGRRLRPPGAAAHHARASRPTPTSS